MLKPPILLLTGAFAQTLNPHQVLMDKGAYLQALEIQEEKTKAAPAGSQHAMELQGLAGFYSFIGDYPSARKLMKQSMQEQGGLLAGPPLKYPEAPVQKRKAVEEIVQAARGRQIVILNEAHEVSRHRAFATQLGLALRKEGFAYFAAETFSPNIEATQKHGYPDRKTGFYVFDPVFGDLVRQMVRVGYKLIAYEAEGEARPPDHIDAINAREATQTRNLIERIFRNDPKARVFLYVGYSHASELEEKLPDGRVLAWMAARLKKETGIDPLTIQQSEVFEPDEEKTPSSSPDPVAQFKITYPTVIRLADGKYWLTHNAQGKMDMQVFHPYTRKKQGRPDWLGMDGYRKPFSLQTSWLPESGRTLIQAFAESEGDDAIPVDHTLLTAGQPAPVLMLPKGNYRLVIQNGKGASRPIGMIKQK